VLFTVAVGFHAVSHSHFRIDDYAHFAQSERMPLLEFVRTPIDVHFAPLHRLVTAMLHQYFATQFPVAVALLVALQIGTLWIVDRLLERIGPSRWNGWLLVIFAANVYGVVLVSYWTSGLHRIPFIAASATCFYGYLRFRDEGRRRDQWLALLACLVAMGFYSKAALLPPMLLAFELCLIRRPAAASVGRRAATFVGFAALLSLYPVAYWFHPLGFEPLLPAFDELPSIFVHSFSVFAQSPFGIVATPQSPFPIAVGVVWACAVVATVYRDRFNAVIWLILVATMAANIAMIGLSQRAHDLGGLIAYQYRYQFELVLPLVVFVRLMIGHGATRSPATRIPAWLASPWWVPVMVAAYALYGAFAADRLMRDHYAANQRAHDYTTRILQELPSQRPLTLLEGRVPRYMWVYDRSLRFQSKFLPLLGIDARYDVPAEPLYRIDLDGHVGRVVAGQTFEFSDLGSQSNRERHRATGVTMDDSGCIRTLSPDPGALVLRLPTPSSLYHGYVSVNYTAAVPLTLRIAAWDDTSGRRESSRALDLPAGEGERLVDVSAKGPEPLRIRALELTIPAPGLCLHTVRLVGYRLEPL